MYTRDEANADMYVAQQLKFTAKFKEVFKKIEDAATSGYDHILYEVKSIGEGYDLIKGLKDAGYDIYITESGKSIHIETPGLKKEDWFKYSYVIEIWWM